jgi:hypothetical protein
MKGVSEFIQTPGDHDIAIGNVFTEVVSLLLLPPFSSDLV